MTTDVRPATEFTGSVPWAHALAEGAPSISGPLPGPRSQELFEKTQKYQYGSYFQMVNALPIALTRGEGVVLIDADGNRYLDFTQGHMVAGLGHGHPRVANAIANQAGRLMNVRDFPTDKRVALMEKLATITPGDLNVFQFFNAGTEATEAALRVARAATGKIEFVSIAGDYHGRTTGAIATSFGNPATGPRPSGFITLPGAFCYRCEYKMTYPDCVMHCVDFLERAMLTNSHGQLAGIIAEPITNGSGGRIYPDEFLPKLREIADRHGMLLILDEFASFARTGRWFAGDHWGVTPDVAIIGKLLGNGFPISVLCVREDLKDALQQTQPSSTHGGQPTACAAALEVVNTIEDDGLLQHATDVGDACLERMQEIADAHPTVGQARGKGLLLAIDFVKDKESREPDFQAGQLFYKKALERGLVTSGGGNVVRVCPPIVISRATALRGFDIADEAITAVEQELGRS
ncbi:MAG TPA: aspartate aminotransferase family protein [Dehalococcoidia bacterium]|nr:aspartate aminotransferase family protein [Dehalococcoidia bacterium]